MRQIHLPSAIGCSIESVLLLQLGVPPTKIHQAQGSLKGLLAAVLTRLTEGLWACGKASPAPPDFKPKKLAGNCNFCILLWISVGFLWVLQVIKVIIQQGFLSRISSWPLPQSISKYPSSAQLLKVGSSGQGSEGKSLWGFLSQWVFLSQVFRLMNIMFGQLLATHSLEFPSSQSHCESCVLQWCLAKQEEAATTSHLRSILTPRSLSNDLWKRRQGVCSYMSWFIKLS